MLTDILPTGFHGAVKAGVGVGSTVYVAGAGPVGLAAAASAQILGAAVVMIGDLNAERLQHAEKVGFEPDRSDQARQARRADRAESSACRRSMLRSTAVGFEASGHGRMVERHPPWC